MSHWTDKRKLVFHLSFFCLFIVIVVSIFIWVTYNPPSCNDGIWNQNELGIDCGGVCEQACPVAFKPLVILWARVFPLGPGLYAAVAYVENQNTGYMAEDVQFEFQFYDEEGKLVTRASKLTHIMPQGVTPVFVPHVISGERAIANTTFRFVSAPRFFLAPDISIAIDHERLFRPQDGKPGAFATAKNNGQETLEHIEFVVVVYDERDVAIATSRTYVERIEPGEVASLYYSWALPFSLRTGDCFSGVGVCTYQPVRLEVLPLLARG